MSSGSFDLTRDNVEQIRTLEHKHDSMVDLEGSFDPTIFNAVTDGVNNVKYTPDQRVQAVAAWIITGSSRKVEQYTGIPANTVRWWMRASSWWPVVRDKLRAVYQDSLDSKLTNIIHKSTDQLEDRIDNGNYERDRKTGNMVRVPLDAKELALAGLAIPMDKRALMRGDPTSRSAKSGAGVLEDLTKLAMAFATIVRQNDPKNITSEVIRE